MSAVKNKSPHISVMQDEFLKFFADCSIKTFFDGTLGAGGHARALLEAHPEIELYIGCDQDPEALELAKKTLEPWKKKIEFVQGNFRHLDQYLLKTGIQQVDGFFLTSGSPRCSWMKLTKALVFQKKGH